MSNRECWDEILSPFELISGCFQFRFRRKKDGITQQYLVKYSIEDKIVHAWRFPDSTVSLVCGKSEVSKTLQKLLIKKSLKKLKDIVRDM